MAGQLSNYSANEILDHMFNNASWTSPTNTYLALFTSNPAADASGDELSGGSYARQELSFAVSSGQTVTSNAAIAFTDMPSTGGSPVTHWAVFDASTSGNMLAYGALPSSIAANSGDEVSIDSGAIDFSFVTG